MENTYISISIREKTLDHCVSCFAANNNVNASCQDAFLASSSLCTGVRHQKVHKLNGQHWCMRLESCFVGCL